MAKQKKPLLNSIMLSEGRYGESNAVVIEKMHIHRYGDEQNFCSSSTKQAEAGMELSNGF